MWGQQMKQGWNRLEEGEVRVVESRSLTEGPEDGGEKIEGAMRGNYIKEGTRDGGKMDGC